MLYRHGKKMDSVIHSTSQLLLSAADYSDNEGYYLRHGVEK